MDGNGRGDPAEAVESMFEALSRSRRRFLLYYLRDRETASVEELATVVSGWLRVREPGTEVVTPGDREQTLIGLHHADLPKLDEAGFVRYDRDDGRVALEPMSEVLDAILETALAHERRATGRSIDAGFDAGAGPPFEGETDGDDPEER